MLTELSSFLDFAKFEDIKARLAHTDTKTALAAEGELSILWAISRVAHFEAEPALPDGHRPDALSNDLFRSGPAVIEIRALSDESFSGREAMDRTANIVAAYADRLRKGAGKHLYFEFGERSYWNKRYHRERCVDPAFRLTPAIEEQLKTWITAANWPSPPSIRIIDGTTDVVITWKERTVRPFRTFCGMPPVAYDLEDNPIYKALKKKTKQVRRAPAGTLRCVMLVDAGCDLLRRLRPMSAVHEIGGEAIIRHAIAKLSIDAVIVFSPLRQRQLVFGGRSDLVWNVSCFDGRETIPDGEYDRLKNLAAQLPRPHLEGYQARDLHKQGGFAPDNRNWHLQTKTITGGGKMTIKLSAGLLHEYLAGKIDADRFTEDAFGKMHNLFAAELMRGNAIQNIKFESGGMDEDDDYVVIVLDVDWGKIARKRE